MIVLVHLLLTLIAIVLGELLEDYTLDDFTLLLNDQLHCVCGYSFVYLGGGGQKMVGVR